MLNSNKNLSVAAAAPRPNPTARRRTMGAAGTTVATLLLALSAAIAQPVLAAPEGGQGQHGHHAARGAGMGMGMGMDGMMMAHPRQMERLFDAIDASPEQRAQIRQIAQAARADLSARRDAGRALRERAVSIFVQPNVDAAQAEVLRRDMLAQHDAASQRVMQAMVDAARVLTPEQRRKLADRMAQRREMMQRHRAERQRAAQPSR